MKTSLQRIMTEDNIELVGLLYEPDRATKKILVHVHGMAGNFYENKFLDFIAETLTSSGIAFFAFNNRGCEYIKDLFQMKDGKRSYTRFGDAYELFDDSVLDIRAAIDFADNKGFETIHLSGHSLGAPKVAHYAANGNDDRLTSIIFLSPADMVGLTKADENYLRDMTAATRMMAEGKGGELLPFPVLWDKIPLSAQSYISLNAETSNVAIFNFYNPYDTLPVLGKIKIASLTIMGKNDDALVVSIDETMRRIKEAMTASPKVETTILGDADHGFNDYEQKLADELRRWTTSF
jgi:alpha-beta hydrolase superfamily lysophospholipase